MDKSIEELVQHVVIERGFEVKLERFGDEVACFVTDPDDPRGGCGSLRGESGPFRSVEQAIAEACMAAKEDRYPQATACGRAVYALDIKAGKWSSCVLAKVHEGPCRDANGNVEESA